MFIIRKHGVVFTIFAIQNCATGPATLLIHLFGRSICDRQQQQKLFLTPALPRVFFPTNQLSNSSFLQGVTNLP